MLLADGGKYTLAASRGLRIRSVSKYISKYAQVQIWISFFANWPSCLSHFDTTYDKLVNVHKSWVVIIRGLGLFWKLRSVYLDARGGRTGCVPRRASQKIGSSV